MDFSVLAENSFWAVPLVVSIVEAFKMSGFNNKFAPLISLIVGLAMSFLINAEIGMGEIIVSGIIYGLTASGLYSSVKTTSNIRGNVPLRINKDAVIVEQFEVEKPLGQTSVQANSELKINQDITSTTSAQSQEQVSKPQAQGSQAQTSQSQSPQSEKSVEQVTINDIEEINVDNKDILK